MQKLTCVSVSPRKGDEARRAESGEWGSWRGAASSPARGFEERCKLL